MGLSVLPGKISYTSVSTVNHDGKPDLKSHVEVMAMNIIDVETCDPYLHPYKIFNQVGSNMYT